MHERYRHTSFKCDECRGQVVNDEVKGEFYCLDCGLVQELIHYGFRWGYEEEED